MDLLCPPYACCCSCCNCCPSCLIKKKGSKYSYVRYSSSKQKPPAVSPLTDPKVTRAEMVFEFAQEKHTHPKMFGNVVTDQPRDAFKRRFSSSSQTSISSDHYSEYITGKQIEYSQTLSRGSSLLDTTTGYDRKRLGSTPDLRIPRKDLTKQKSADDVQGVRNLSWVPALPVLEENMLNEDSHPIIQFSLYYDVQHSALTVHLHHAKNLPALDRRGTSDPFIVMYILPNKEEIFESKVIQQTLSPVFDQSFEFKKFLPGDIRQQTLVMRVYDHDRFSKNDTIGGVVLPLESADLFGVVMRMRIEEKPEIFTKNSNGDLLISLSYDPILFLLKGIVLKATNLKKQDVIGLADPYIKVALWYENKKIGKWKSSIKRNTLIPVYNEVFQFDVLGKDINEMLMEVFVMDYDRFSRNDAMGEVKFGSSVEGESERKHWRDMILNPKHSISQWHTLMSVT